MSYTISKPITIADASVAVLSFQKASKSAGKNAAWITCQKTPLIVVTRTDGEFTAQRLDGGPVTMSQIEDLCPGALASFDD